ncbi:hypothetical protein U3516DRAFT_743433 [Neocallimastix sp. 'constans']
MRLVSFKKLTHVSNETFKKSLQPVLHNILRCGKATNNWGSYTKDSVILLSMSRSFFHEAKQTNKLSKVYNMIFAYIASFINVSVTIGDNKPLAVDHHIIAIDSYMTFCIGNRNLNGTFYSRFVAIIS